VLIKRLFLRLANNYGTAWTGRFASAELLEAAKAEWAIDLARYRPGEIGQAIELCKRQFQSKPPTLGEFRALCAAMAAGRTIAAATAAPRAERGKALGELARLRGLLETPK
jgi:hypothetical protein